MSRNLEGIARHCWELCRDGAVHLGNEKDRVLLMNITKPDKMNDKKMFHKKLAFVVFVALTPYRQDHAKKMGFVHPPL